jgi:hypothetical protein
MKILKWLFPAYYAEVAKCRWCGDVVSKCRMVHTGDGWFCDEEEAEKAWLWWRQT